MYVLSIATEFCTAEIISLYVTTELDVKNIH